VHQVGVELYVLVSPVLKISGKWCGIGKKMTVRDVHLG